MGGCCLIFDKRDFATLLPTTKKNLHYISFVGNISVVFILLLFVKSYVFFKFIAEKLDSSSPRRPIDGLYGDSLRCIGFTYSHGDPFDFVHFPRLRTFINMLSPIF